MVQSVAPTKPQYDILVSRQAVNLFLAGQGSGKSHCAGLISANYISNFPKVRGIICANTYGQLNLSTLFRIREVWRISFGMREYSDKTRIGCYVIGRQPPRHFITEGHNFDSYNNIISFDNGAVIYIGSLDNYKALDGLEVGWAILDETKDTKEAAVKEVITGRLRQPGMYVDAQGRLCGIAAAEDGNTNRSFNPLYIFTSPANVPWINEWFFLNDFEKEINELIFSETTYFRKAVSNKFVTISSTYLNIKNLPDSYIENQKANLNTGLQDMLIYGSPFSKVGGEFYKYFDRTRHVAKCPYDPSLPLHISFDENTVPYLPIGIFQMKGLDLFMIDEIAGEDPYNTIGWVCAEFIRRYNNHVAGLFIYGDATSQKNDVRQMGMKRESDYDFFRLIENALAKYKPTRRVGRSNPSVTMRGNFINTVFEKQLYGCTFTIDEKCKRSITDYTMTKQAADGGKNKKPITVNEVSYQPYGHFTDLGDYIMCEVWAEQYNKYQKGDRPFQALHTAPRHSRF